MDKMAKLSLLTGSERNDAIKAEVMAAFGRGKQSELEELVNALASESVPLSASRPALGLFADCLGEQASEELKSALLPVALNAISGRAASFPNFDCKIRRMLADTLTNEGECAQAAAVLARINVSAGGRTFSPEEVAEHYVRVAELYLEDDLTVDAQMYIKKASEVIHRTGDPHLKLRYRVSYARIQDSQGKFLEASLKYYQLSQAQEVDVADEDLITLLTNALTCACLASAGPHRSRMMDTVYRDARAPTVQGYFMLDRMYRQQIVRKEEVERFRAYLLPHQQAETADDMTVYDRAIVQHNMLAASLIYENVSFDALAVLLNIDAHKAEKIASTMIAEGRLQATIDQTEGCLLFEASQSMLMPWDETLKGICGAVNKACDSIEERYPSLYAQSMAEHK